MSTFALQFGVAWPMDVSVLSKDGHRRLRPVTRPSLLGQGLLERARATSLALLGLTGAVGLAMVALVLNQGWPLVPGSPIPPLEAQRQALGDAAVAAAPGVTGAVGRGPAASPSQPRGDAGGAEKPPVQHSPSPANIVVSESTPAGPPASSPGDSPPQPAPVGKEPAATPAPTPATPASPPAQTPVASVGTPPSQPPVSSSGTPPSDSSEEPDGEEGTDGDCPEGCDDDGDGSSGGWSHGHGYGYGHGHGHW